MGMRGQRASFCRVRPQSTLDMCTRHGLRGLSSAPFLGETRQGGRRTGQSPSSRCVRPRGTDSVLTRGTERALCKESLPAPARPGSLRVSFPVDDLLAQGSSGDGTQTPGLCESENKRGSREAAGAPPAARTPRCVAAWDVLAAPRSPCPPGLVHTPLSARHALRSVHCPQRRPRPAERPRPWAQPRARAFVRPASAPQKNMPSRPHGEPSVTNVRS